MPCLFLALLAAAGPDPGTLLHAEPTPRVRIAGNRAVPSSIYRRLIETRLEPSAREDPSRVAGLLERFLEEAGFPYADVEAERVDGQLRVVVDEGTIERVTFPGQSGFAAVLASTVFDLEHGVFEIEAFRRAVRELESTLGTTVEGFEMTATSTGGEVRFQLHHFDLLEVAFPPLGRYTLALRLESIFMSPGWGLDLASTGPDGLVTEVRHRWQSVFAGDDRLKLGGEIGLRVGELVGGSGAPLLSRGGLVAEALSPALGAGFRVTARMAGSYLNRQRRDLALSSYDLFEPEAAVGLFWRDGPRRELRLELGGDYRYIIHQTLGEPGAQPTTTGKLRAFAELAGGVSLWLPLSGRFDQELRLEGHLRGYASPGPYGDFRLTANRSFPFGVYSDLRLEARLAALVGDFGLLDEYRVSNFLRGLYGDLVYTSAAATLSSEVFFSLERQIIRVSVFADGIVHRGSRFAGDTFEARPGLATGAGLHGLIFSTFQLSIYGVVGVIDGDGLDVGANLSLMRLF